MLDIINAEDSATMLGLRTTTFLAYRRDGRIEIEPAGRFGNTLVFDRAEVEALAEARKRAAA
ncbi:MAG: hypothetical protein ACRDPS_09690 [Nocardioides sp.]|uniref:hypothetical protein n=1 Tax=Nocardioides sp. TaxID=35761 RepID=UPI003D6BA56A